MLKLILPINVSMIRNVSGKMPGQAHYSGNVFENNG